MFRFFEKKKALFFLIEIEEDIDARVKKAQNGDIDALGALYDHFLNPIYRYLFFRVSSESEAEDLTEEVFYKMMDHLKKYKKRTNMPFSAWLFRIAKNTLIDYYRSRKVTEEIPETQADLSRDADTRHLVEGSIEKKRLLIALEKLPENQKQAIALRFFAERSNAEISAVLNKSETAVRILQSRGLKRLRLFLEHE